MAGRLGSFLTRLRSTERWSQWPLPAALTLAAYLGVRQADLLLRQFQQADTRAFGVSALGGGLVPRPGDAAMAVELWNGRENATLDQARTFVLGHATMDVVLTLCVVGLALALARRVADQGDTRVNDWNRHPFLGPRTEKKWWRRLKPLGYFLVLGPLTIALRLLTFWLDGAVFGYWLAYIASKLALIALAAVALALLVGLRGRLAEEKKIDGESAWVLGDERRAERRRYRRAGSVLRGQLGLVLVLSLLLLVDGTGQVADFFRRWDDVLSICLGLICVLVLCFTFWASVRRIMPAAETGTPVEITWKGLLLVGVPVAAAGLVVRVLSGSWVALSLGGVFLVLLGLDVFARFANWKPEQRGNDEGASAAAASEMMSPEEQQAMTQKQREAIQQLGRFVAAVPLVVVGIELVKAGVGPLILAFRPQGYTFFQGVVPIVVGLAVIVAGCVMLPEYLARKDSLPAVRGVGLAYVLVAVAVFVLSAAFVIRPLGVPEFFGSLAVVATAFAALCLAFNLLQGLSERTVPWGLGVLGVKRTPVFLLLALWFVIASVIDTSGHHDIRTTTVEPAEVPLADVWSDWLAQNCVGSSSQPVPLVFVVTEGGGIRAAYWTSSVLTDTFEVGPSDEDDGEAPCASASPLSRVFALSGISGGSVGAAAYFAQGAPTGNWYEEALGAPDYSAVALARGFFVDLPRALIGFGGDDRAGMLERAWESRIPGLDQDYFTHLAPGAADGTWMPITMFNGAQAETGCRLNTSAVRLTSPDQELENVGDCRAVIHRFRYYTLDGKDAQYRVKVPAATVTVDSIAVAQECSRSFRVSTAALMSARWPYISPSGRNPCGPPWVSAVDGGYADPAGYAGFHDLWQQLAPLVARHNAGVTDDEGLVVPVLVNIDNHYQSNAKAADPRRTAELLVPPLGWVRAGGTKGADREQTALSLVATSPPGSSLACELAAYDPDGPQVENPDGQVVKGEQRPVGRVLLAPTTRPGLPAPLAWTLASGSRQDLDDQRDDLFEGDGAGVALRKLLAGSADAITCHT